ncbi:MAG: glutathione S-transferase N-terminal domain-containing protein [Pseudomonadota bacterium]
MQTLLDHPVTQFRPPQHPERLQLYSFPTPNGVKASIALEEIGLPYEAHLIALNETTEPPFLALNPNNKIPAIIDPDGPGGKPLALWESGAILLYLAEKTGKLLPEDPARRHETVQWLMFQMGGVGPMFGQFGHFFKFAADKITDDYPTKRYQAEAKRLLGVLEQRLDGREFIMDGDYTIADIAIFPWIRGARIFYGAEEALDFASFPKTLAWAERCEARPASQTGLNVPARD